MSMKIWFPLALLVAALPFGCGTGGSSRQESCSKTSDCNDGLICQPTAQGGVCVQNEYPVEATNKECIAVQCAEDVDCCDDFEPAIGEDACTDAAAACAEDDTSFECQTYEEFCVCNLTCQDKQCLPKPEVCETDDDCLGAATGPLCDPSGKCVECLTTAEDCNADDGETCVDGECIDACKIDEDCGVFEACNTKTGLCAYSGCKSDRECILLTENADSVCEKQGKAEFPSCIVPCEKNSECGELNVCQDGQCVYLGCEKNTDCINLLKIQGRLQEGDTAECRDIALRNGGDDGPAEE